MASIRDKVSRLGRLVSSTRHSWPARGGKGQTNILSIGVEMIIDLFRDGLANAGHPLQLTQACAGNGSGRPEMVQQCPLTPCPNPCDLIERRLTERLGALGPVRANRKAVCLIAEALQKVEDRVPGIEREWRSPRQKEALAPGVAVGALGYRPDRDVVNAELVKNALCGIELSQAAVDQNEVGPHASIAFRIFLEGPRKTALQHFTHHCVIVPAGYGFARLRCAACVRRSVNSRRGSDTANGKFPIGVFNETIGSRDDHRADRICTLDVAVVVDFDAVERPLKPKCGVHAVEQLALRRALRKTAAERFAGCTENADDKPPFIAAARYRKRHAPAMER